MKHKWFFCLGIWCCRVCGICRRHDGSNKPCKGPTSIGLRENTQGVTHA